jgi:hypothetical protein
LSAGVRVPSGQERCPICRKILTESEHRAALVNLQKSTSKLYANLLRTERRRFEDNLSKIKKDQKARLETMKKSQAVQHRILRRRLRDEKLKYRKRLDQDLMQLKRRYQIQAENIRDFYGKQASLQTKQEIREDSDLAAIISQHETLANNIMARLDEIRDVLAKGSHVKSGEPHPSNSSLVRDDSKASGKSSEAEKFEKLKEIAEIIKQISAEHKRNNDIYHNTDTL